MPVSAFTIGGDLPVARLGFGTARLTGTGCWGPPADRDAAITVLRRAVTAGVTLIDTADNYGPDVAEELIAQALYPYPADLMIASKGGVIRTGPDQWHHAGRPGQLRAACEASLRRLRLETIPLYQLHRIDPDVPVPEQLGALTELQQQGKIRHIGLDTITADQLHEALTIAPIASVQNKYNLFHRDHTDVLDLCERNGFAFLPYLPLRGGNLAQTSGREQKLADIAETHNATTGQIMLAWLLHISPVVLPTPGTTTIEHLLENLAADAIALSPDDIHALNTLCA